MSITEIIARLGNACGLPWARCPVDHWAGDCCDRERWHAGNHDDGKDDGYTWGKSETPPTLAEWAAEWERDHPGEPGPVASWTDGRSSWDVTDGGFVIVRVGKLSACKWECDSGWAIETEAEDAATADLAELVRLMQAVDGAR